MSGLNENIKFKKAPVKNLAYLLNLTTTRWKEVFG